MRFYLDEDMSPRVAAIARSRRCDVTSCHECGQNGLPDEAQLKLAASDGRCLVTRSASDLVPLTRSFSELGLPHAGVLLVPGALSGKGFAQLAAALVRYSELHPEGLPPYGVDYLGAG